MTSASPLPGVVRLLCDLRLALLALAVLAGAFTTRSAVVMVVLLLALPLSYVPLRRWETLAPRLRRMPLLLVLDVAFATVLLLVAGAPQLMLLYALSTVLLGGLVFGPLGGWVAGGLMGGVLVAAAVTTAVAGAATVDAVVTLGGYALLYALAGLGGARLHQIFDEYVRAGERARLDSRRAAHAEERARLAREMHDRVSKTVQGIRLLAVSLRSRLQRDDVDGARRDVEHLVEAADIAGRDARRLLQDLRTDVPDAPLSESVARAVDAWSARTEVESTFTVTELEDGLGGGSRYELLCVLGEALENVHRHAGAERVDVHLSCTDGWVRLQVTDDGTGFEVPEDVRQLGTGGHYGLVGMQERAVRAGGRLEVGSSPGDGTQVALRVPAALPADPRVTP